MEEKSDDQSAEGNNNNVMANGNQVMEKGAHQVLNSIPITNIAPADIKLGGEEQKNGQLG